MSNSPRVLVADDEVRFAEALRQGLSRTDYDVTVVNDGDAALARALSGGFDLILLDLMLPGLSGYRVVERLRAAGNQTPIIMLTAKDGEYDEADAFDLGVDDYLTKPFSTVVLLARMRSLLRRSPDTAVQEVVVGDLRLDPRKHRCMLGSTNVTLTPREFDVTLYLAQRAGSVVSKRELLEHVWDEPELDPNVVEVCILQVRKKLGNELISTVRGVGYRLGE
ncbi:MAG: hypothetical protein RL205_901 [Actinomycetota bacterium]|jgi:DNA-binding response OmpR family regulator